MMDPIAFAALVERCALEKAPLQPLAAIVRQASDFEPLIITIDGRRPVRLRAADKAEAIALASEARMSGETVRVGLAGVDARDLDRLGLTLADGFEPCSSLKAAAQLLDTDPKRLKPDTDPARSEPRRAEHPIRKGTSEVSEGERGSPRQQPSRAWNVFSARRSSLLVYGADQSD